MRTFDQPGAAMHAYERSLMRQPRSEPFTHRNVPTLWERAKAMFAKLVDAITSAADLVQRARMPRTARRDLLARLVPLEGLVRMLLVVEAATHLLMTPEGARLRIETPKIDLPPPPPPVGVTKPVFSTRILMPGWHTIAALRPVIDPRIAEREQREALERRRIEREAWMNGDALPAAEDDPATWRCRFNVLHWVRDPDPSAPQQAPQPKKAKLPFTVFSYEDTNFPVHPDLIVRDARRAAQADVDMRDDNRDLARRIEALSRVLANPAPAIRRLARHLAALKAEDLDNPWFGTKGLTRNAHAFNECISALRHHDRLMRALIAAAPFAGDTPAYVPGHKHDEG